MSLLLQNNNCVCLQQILKSSFNLLHIFKSIIINQIMLFTYKIKTAQDLF